MACGSLIFLSGEALVFREAKLVSEMKGLRSQGVAKGPISWHCGSKASKLEPMVSSLRTET